MKKIGILTLPLNLNYGGVIQSYASKKNLENLGYDAYVINRRWNNNDTSLSYKIKKSIYHKIIGKEFTRFKKKYITNNNIEITSDKDMNFLNNFNLSSIIVGSDQVWRYSVAKGVGYNYFLDFITNKDIKKISYAASFGSDELSIDNDVKEKLKILLSDFDHISTRELSGVKIMKDEFNLQSKLVLDPTLLLNSEDYISDLNLKVNQNKKVGYYLLDINQRNMKIIDDVCAIRKKNSFNLNKQGESLSISQLIKSPKSIIRPSIESWIEGFYNSDFIITDSFHGTVFSILFNKQFISIGNRRRGLARFESILNVLGISDRLILEETDYIETIKKEIDYDKVNKKLNILRIESKKYLVDSIEGINE